MTEAEIRALEDGARSAMAGDYMDHPLAETHARFLAGTVTAFGLLLVVGTLMSALV